MKKIGLILAITGFSLSSIYSQSNGDESKKLPEKPLTAIRNNSRDNIIVYKNNLRRTIRLQRKVAVMNQKQMKTNFHRRMILQRRRHMINQQKIRQRYIRHRIMQQQKRR